MNKKLLAIFIFALTVGIVYAVYPKTTFDAENLISRQEACQDVLAMVEPLATTLETSFAKNNFHILEKGFGLNSQARKIATEMDGVDPVLTAMDLMRSHATELNWQDYEVFTFNKAKNSYELIVKDNSDQYNMVFMLRKHKNRLIIVSIQKVEKTKRA